MSQDWNVDEDHDLNGNLDDSLSGLCIEMDNNSNFNMTDTLLALPLFDIDQKPVILQYPHVEQMISITLNAPTSPAIKIEDESLTYLNQGQPYELKFQYIGGAFKTQRLLKSYIKVAFHDRRLQYCEEKQIQVWRNEHPYDRILEVDTPLSRGIIEAKNLPFNLNMIEVLWDPCKTASVYVKINCISTEFTPKKHGGEKGVPFRLQIDTYILNMGNFLHIYSAYAQVKIFKPKGADRKHKTDKEKFEKQTNTDKCKFQPSCPFTILTETLPDAEFMCKPNSSQICLDNASPCSNENHISSTKKFDKVALKSTQHETSCVSNDSFKDKGNTKNVRVHTNSSEKRRDQSVDNIGSTMPLDYEPRNQLVKKRLADNDHKMSNVVDTHEDKIYANSHKIGQNSMASGGQVKRETMSSGSAPAPPLNSTVHSGAISSDACKDYYYLHDALLNGTGSSNNKLFSSHEQHSPYPTFTTPADHAQHLYPASSLDLELGDHDLELELADDSGLPLVLPVDDAQSSSESAAAWLASNNFNSFIINAFRNFSPLDMRRLSRQDLVEICGVADGIRLNNAIQCVPPRARLTIYVTRKTAATIKAGNTPPPQPLADLQSTTSSNSSASNNGVNLTLSQEDLHGQQFSDASLLDGVYFAFHLYDLTRDELFNRFGDNFGASNFAGVNQIYLTYPPAPGLQSVGRDGQSAGKGTLGHQLVVVANDKVIQHLPDGSRYTFCVDLDTKHGFSYILMECCDCGSIGNNASTCA